MSLFSNYIPLKNDLERYIEHCKTSFKQIGDSNFASFIEGCSKELENHRYNITIIGSLKRGKSTLLNTLMERHNDDISPISSNVCTSAIIKYLDKNLICSKNECAVVYFDAVHDDCFHQPLTIPFKQLKEYITEELNPENRRHVKSVDVHGDFPSWSKAVTIIDSPGQNSVFSYHDTLLTDFLPYTDAIIFLVAADIPLDGGDIALLKELSEDEKRKIFFVLTKVDNIDNPEDIEDVKSFVLAGIQKTGLSCNKLYTVSAKLVYDALQNDVTGPQLDSIKAENGILELEEDLARFIVAESNKTKKFCSRVERLLSNVSEACNKYISSSKELLSQKEYDLNCLEAQKMELQNKNEKLKMEAKQSLEKFRRSWEKILRSFKRKFSAKADVIEDRINDRHQKGGLLGDTFMCFKLTKQAESVIGGELKPLLLDLNKKLEEIIITLNSELDNEISLYTKHSNVTDTGSVIGSALVATTMTGIITGGISVSTSYIGSALSALNTWKTAAVASNTASASASVSVGALERVWMWLRGTETGSTAATAATAAAEAANAGTLAIMAGVTAVVTAGTSIAVTFLVQKILHMLLVSSQKTRVDGITEKIMNDMEASIFKSLDTYKEELIKEYQQHIDAMLTDNDDPAKRKLISKSIGMLENLLSEGIHVQKQLPMFQ